MAHGAELTLHPSITGDGPFESAPNGKRFAAKASDLGMSERRLFHSGYLQVE
jgi:hypothetical protein